MFNDMMIYEARQQEREAEARMHHFQKSTWADRGCLSWLRISAKISVAYSMPSPQRSPVCRGWLETAMQGSQRLRKLLQSCASP
jgi:hypothetical protein